ncbi:MAG TPA: DUF2911 domain-containing protein [Terracidiphilus sp.]|jgi:hypothetical protein|nr:DUF2911 domain-containing protein [Terracidiphilus sp.]
MPTLFPKGGGWCDNRSVGTAFKEYGLCPKENVTMNRGILLAAALIAATPLLAQNAPKKPPVSPPADASATIGGKTVSVHYNSPAVKGREGQIFTKDGKISHDPHYPVWRAGANPATLFKTEGDITVGDLKVPAGTYTLFVDISDPDNWTLIVNKQTGQWGLAYDGSQDLGKTKMTMSKPPAMVENLVYTITDNGGGKGTLTLAWEDHSASVPISVP